jgi:hypothetical protein
MSIVFINRIISWYDAIEMVVLVKITLFRLKIWRTGLVDF